MTHHSMLWSYVPFYFQQWLWQSFVKLPIYIWHIFNFNVSQFQKIYSNCGTYWPLSFVYACRDVCTEQDTQCILTRRQSQHMRAFTCSPEFISACYNRKPLYAFRDLNCQALIKTKKSSDPLTLQKTHRGSSCWIFSVLSKCSNQAFSMGRLNLLHSMG